MTCDQCQNWNLKKSKLARQGFGNCAFLPKWEHVSQGCAKFESAEPAVIAARLAWLNKHQQGAMK